jgi:hypothetical protein
METLLHRLLLLMDALLHRLLLLIDALLHRLLLLMDALLHRLLFLSKKLYKALLHRLLLLSHVPYILTDRIKHGHDSGVLLDGLEVPTPGCLIAGSAKGQCHSREIRLLGIVHRKRNKVADPVAFLILSS